MRVRAWRVVSDDPLVHREIQLPCGEMRATGFWSTRRACIAALLRALVDEAAWAWNGWLGSGVYVLEADVEPDPEIPVGVRTGPYNPAYDEGEVFVSSIAHVHRLRRWAWVEFWQAHGMGPV